ncbi:hypothetical protein BE04_26680 [Sorangium cellulosum]|uniref:Uncharacterized protein n=2 Tax=Sorangium cellulosum TaxID=56 RepID=A0A150NZU8_SORCE|nr:hypothetical protein [Sorangium cellulosum]AGP33718.1 hypothetical protein SCE1572_03930 [Sorangium cellulosum So0157-2]KYF47906.1 hypothetical protein BE04_26680 [Sorangium cellulosum]
MTVIHHVSTSASPAAAPEPLSSATVVDLGKQKRKDIKQLRKGQGPLAQAVLDTVAELKTSGTSPAGSIVVVVVEEKSKRALRFF